MKKSRTNTGASPATLAIRKLRLMTAIKTPYTKDGLIDLAAYDRHVEHQIEHGVEALIIGGTTGEGHLLSWDEHLVLIAHTKAKFGSKIVVVGNTGGMCTGESAAATRKGFAAGMDCSLLINPYYGKTSSRGIIMHIESGLQYGPGIIYNVPGRTGQDIKPELIMQLADHENFVGVKECMGHERIKELSSAGVACWSGNDDQCHVSRYEHGGVGVISVTSNIVPGLMHKLMFGGHNPELDQKLAPLFKWLFTEPNPIGVNTMMMQLGMAEPVFRLPYTHTSRSMREEALEVIKTVGTEHFPKSAAGLRVLEDSDFEHVLGCGI